MKETGLENNTNAELSVMFHNLAAGMEKAHAGMLAGDERPPKGAAKPSEAGSVSLGMFLTVVEEMTNRGMEYSL